MPMSPRLLRPRTTLHPEATAWRTAVIANGGTVSGTTLSAVDKFCKAIDAAGIRDRFYRLNLFCGSFLGALVPLYRGPSRSGTQYGGTIDTNNNFVSGDYAESDGLLGNTTTKWLNTGFAPDSAGMSANSFHIAAVWPTYSHPANSNWFPLACINSTVNLRFWLNNNSYAANTSIETYLGSSSVNIATKVIAAANGATIPGGLWLSSRTSATSLRMYNGDTEQASYTGSLPDATAPTNPVTVFARYNGSTTFGHSAIRLRGYSVGLGLTAAQVAAFNTAMSAFQTAMGRT
jgi:hypothetical protein